MQETNIFPKPPSGYTHEGVLKRRKWAQTYSGVAIDDSLRANPEDLKGIIEYQAGYVPVPMAVVGPLLIHGTYASGTFVVPICTVEGALTISMCRGMLAIAASGGVDTVHIKQELSRSPAFIMQNVHEIPKFITWVSNNFDAIKKIAEISTKYGKLIRIDTHVMQRWVILDMVFDTANAAGQNMVTLASEVASRHIAEKTGVKYILESGFNSDKKPSWKNLFKGRGHHVVAEVTLGKQVLRRLLNTNAEEINQLHDISISVKHSIGAIGAFLNVSNALTGIYIATGQDAACAAENSVGHLQVKTLDDGGLRVNLTLPSITVGTVGGGTRLPVQKKNLHMIGCDGSEEHSSKKLAEVATAATMALEISLLSSIVSNTFTSAHIRYGRENKQDKNNG